MVFRSQLSTHFLSEVVRCDASQKKDLRDSTKGTAQRSLLLEMCRRLRLITRNYFLAGFFFLATNAFSTSIWKSDNTFI